MSIDYKYCNKIMSNWKDASGFFRTFISYDNKTPIKKGDTFFPEFASNAELTNSKYTAFIQSLSEFVISAANNNPYYNEWCSSNEHQDLKGDINYGTLRTCVQVIKTILDAEMQDLCHPKGDL